MPTLLARLTFLAPRLNIEIPPTSGDNIAMISNGNADIGMGVYTALPSRSHSRSLYDESLVCVVRRDHPVVKQGLTLDRFIDLLHISVIITGQGESNLDQALAQQGLKRRIAVKLPHFLAAAMITAESDMILSLPRQLAHRLVLTTPLAILEMPFALPSFTPSMIWHERRHHDPAHVWLRKQIVEVIDELAPNT